jgi:hypothetical protein
MSATWFAAALTLLAIAVLIGMVFAIRWAESDDDNPTEHGDGES